MNSRVKTPQQNGIDERQNGHLLDQTHLLIPNKMFQKILGERLFSQQHI